MTFAKKTIAAAFALLLCVTAFAFVAEAQEYGSFDDVLAEYRNTDLDDDGQPDPDAFSYALHDIDANGADELLITSPWFTNIYTSANGQTHLAGEFGPRSRLLSIEDGNWYVTGSGGAANTIYEVQRLSDDGAALLIVESWASDWDGSAMFYTHTRAGEEERISEEEYTSVAERFDTMPDDFFESLTWQPLSAADVS